MLKEVVIMAIDWKYKNNSDRRSYKALPSGVYWVQIESVKESVSSSGNQVIKMVLGVLSHENKVKNLLTFSPEHQDMVNKALGEIYSSFGIPKGNLEPQRTFSEMKLYKVAKIKNSTNQAKYIFKFAEVVSKTS